MLHSNKTSKPVMTVHTSQKKKYLLLQSCSSLSIKLAMLPLYPLQPLQNGLVNQSITIVQKHVISLYINIKIATQKWHHKSNKTVSKYHTFFPSQISVCSSYKSSSKERRSQGRNTQRHKKKLTVANILSHLQYIHSSNPPIFN